MLRNVHIPDTISREFPPNVGIGLTHGSSYVPEDFYPRLNPDMRANNNRLLSNFSDEGTVALIPEYVPRDQVVVALASRAVGDPNRAKDAWDLFRKDDFNEVRLWDEPPTPEEQAELLNRFYDPYHAQTEALLARLEERNPNPRDKLFYIDLHDTGNLMMKPDPAEHTLRDTKPPHYKLMPPMCLSYRDRKTCAPEIFDAFVELVTRHTGITPRVDWPYEGGYMIRRYGELYNDALPSEARFRRNCIQIEVGRFLYVDEATQTLRIDETRRLREALMQAICDLGVAYLS